MNSSSDPKAELRRKQKGAPFCGRCYCKLVYLSDSRRINHLSAGQLQEERCESIEHLVYKCAKCAKVEIVSNTARLVELCSSCNYHTIEIREELIREATPDIQGELLEHLNCLNCQKMTVRKRSFYSGDYGQIYSINNLPDNGVCPGDLE